MIQSPRVRDRHRVGYRRWPAFRSVTSSFYNRRALTVEGFAVAPVAETDLAAAAAEAHQYADEIRRRLDDGCEIHALELRTLTREALLKQLSKLIAELDRLAHEDDPRAGRLAEWARETRSIYRDTPKAGLIGAVLYYERLVEPARAHQRRLLEELAIRIVVDPKTGPLFTSRNDLRQLSAADRDAVTDAVAQALAKWWESEAGHAALRRQFANMKPWF